MKVAVVKESAPGERRVALVPEMIARLRGAGLEVLVESGAGDGAWFADSAYAEAGATVVSRDELLADADLILTVGQPDEQILAAGSGPARRSSACSTRWPTRAWPPRWRPAGSPRSAWTGCPGRCPGRRAWTR